MIIYEVNLAVDRAILEDWVPWLTHHVSEMLLIEGFEGARVYRDVEAGTAERDAFCCHYELASRAALDRYLAEDAPRMRADGQQRFGGRFSASRRILEPLAP